MPATSSSPHPPGRPWFGRHGPAIGRGVLTLAIAAAGSALFVWIGTPLPFMLGALCATTAAGLAGLPIALPGKIRWAVAPAIGVMLGGYFTPELLANVLHWWDGLLAVVAMMAISIALGPIFFRKLFGFDRQTAFFSATPGGAAEMILLGGMAGGDSRIIALIQTVRVGIIVMVVPFVLRAGGVLDPATDVVGRDVVAGEPLDWLILAGCAVVGLWLGIALKLPAGAILGPLIVSAAVHLVELSTVSPPRLLVGLAQVVLGTLIGLRFRSMREIKAARVVLASFGWTACLLAIGASLAYLAHQVGPAGYLAYFIALAPGGVAEMTLLTIAAGVEVAFVTTCHILRIVLVYVTLPVIMRRELANASMNDPPDPGGGRSSG